MLCLEPLCLLIGVVVSSPSLTVDRLSSFVSTVLKILPNLSSLAFGLLPFDSILSFLDELDFSSFVLDFVSLLLYLPFSFGARPSSRLSRRSLIKALLELQGAGDTLRLVLSLFNDLGVFGSFLTFFFKLSSKSDLEVSQSSVLPVDFLDGLTRSSLGVVTFLSLKETFAGSFPFKGFFLPLDVGKDGKD